MKSNHSINRSNIIIKCIILSSVLIGCILILYLIAQNITYDTNIKIQNSVENSTSNNLIESTDNVASDNVYDSTAQQKRKVKFEIVESELFLDSGVSDEVDSYKNIILESSGPGYAHVKDTMDATVIRYTEEIGPMYGIDATLLQSIIFYESSNRQNVCNGQCVGYMQVSTRWHLERAKTLGANLYDGYGNIITGTNYLAELISQYHNLHTALMVYHGESDALAKAANGEVSEYVNNIMDLYYKLLGIKYGD